jgi:hypothetical protein
VARPLRARVLRRELHGETLAPLLAAAAERPHLVSMRARKPCVLMRRLLRGRYVGFPIVTPERLKSLRGQTAKPSRVHGLRQPEGCGMPTGLESRALTYPQARGRFASPRISTIGRPRNVAHRR